jgi:hypothetical protein
MSQQFRIDSDALRAKINSLLPSQSRGSINVDLTGQTTIVPVVDLTETAEGSTLREDLQSSASFDVTSTEIANTTTTVISTTGFFKCFAQSGTIFAGGAGSQQIVISDGVTDKVLFDFQVFPEADGGVQFVEFIVCVGSGESVKVTSGGASQPIRFVSRQIATITGELVNPTALQT